MLQKRRLRELRKTLLKSPYYREMAKNQTILEEFPIMNKKLFMHNFNEINTCQIRLDEAMSIASKAEQSRDFSPMLGKITIGLSTGTSGNRGVFLVDESERAKWVAAIIDRVIGVSFHRRKVAFFLRANSNLYESVQSSLIKFEFFDLLESFESFHLKRLAILNPDILIAQPSMLSIIAKNIKNKTLNIQPQKVISIAEVLSPEDNDYLSDIFGVQINQVYQCSEGFLASTCKNGTLHFNEDTLIIERKYIDDERTRFHPVITDLMRTTQPIVRYELNDILIEKKNCSCGSKFTAIASIEGRSDDIFIFNCHNQQIRVFPDFLSRAIVLSDAAITDFCITQISSNELKLYIASKSTDSFTVARNAVNKLLFKMGIEGVVIKQEFQNPNIVGINKRRRVRNELPKAN